jgi:MFS family permease
MRVLTSIVPRGLEGTAQALYGMVGVGTATALLSLASGWLYGRVDAWGFTVMALLCVLAIPVASACAQVCKRQLSTRRDIRWRSAPIVQEVGTSSHECRHDRM